MGWVEPAVGLPEVAGRLPLGELRLVVAARLLAVVRLPVLVALALLHYPLRQVEVLGNNQRYSTYHSIPSDTDKGTCSSKLSSAILQ